MDASFGEVNGKIDETARAIYNTIDEKYDDIDASLSVIRDVIADNKNESDAADASIREELAAADASVRAYIDVKSAVLSQAIDDASAEAQERNDVMEGRLLTVINAVKDDIETLTGGMQVADGSLQQQINGLTARANETDE